MDPHKNTRTRTHLPSLNARTQTHFIFTLWPPRSLVRFVLSARISTRKLEKSHFIFNRTVSHRISFGSLTIALKMGMRSWNADAWMIFFLFESSSVIRVALRMRCETLQKFISTVKGAKSLIEFCGPKIDIFMTEQAKKITNFDFPHATSRPAFLFNVSFVGHL